MMHENRERLREDFERDGIVFPLPVLSARETNELRRSWDRLEKEESLDGRATTTTHSRHFDLPFVQEIVRSPSVLDYVELVLGPDITLFGTRFFCKYPSDSGHHVSWHQDLDSWDLHPPIACTAWLAIDDSHSDNGCMRVLLGSHRAGVMEHTTTQDETNMLGRGQRVAVLDDAAARAVDVTLDPGQMSIHHGALVHSSSPNRSTRRRCGLAMRFIPGSVRQGDASKSPRAQVVPLRVRGVEVVLQ